MEKRIVILDAGAQYGKLIDRRIRELNVETEVLALNTPCSQYETCAGVIISGGPASVNAGNAPNVDENLFKLNIPVLGLCYGMQLLNKHFGGSVGASQGAEDGQFVVNVDQTCVLFSKLAPEQKVLLTHGDTVDHIAPNFMVVARTMQGQTCAIANPARKLYGLQFHPETDLTVNGEEMMRAFVQDVCGLTGAFTISSRLNECLQHIKSVVGLKQVIVLLSGGVDSTVCGALLKRALAPQQIVALHIDNGFMRKNESEKVVARLTEVLGLRVQLVGAGKRFQYAETKIMVKRPLPRGAKPRTPAELAKLTTHQIFSDMLVREVDPETKRRIIGDTFVELTREHIEQTMQINRDTVLLAQGTLRPDLIESASLVASGGGTAQVIKTHHNDTELVRQLRDLGRVIEPLKDFHKDEVRQLGAQLGLPNDILVRHPFPGPGLALRVICANAPFFDSNYSRAGSLVNLVTRYAELSREGHGLIRFLEQTLSERDLARLRDVTTRLPRVHSQLLPIKSVGVQGDCRSYSHVVSISLDWSSSSPAAGTYTQSAAHFSPNKRVGSTPLGVNSPSQPLDIVSSPRRTQLTPGADQDKILSPVSLYMKRQDEERESQPLSPLRNQQTTERMEGVDSPSLATQSIENSPTAEQWRDLYFISDTILRVCRQSVNRVCYVFGPAVTRDVKNVTVTHLTTNAVRLIRAIDDLAQAHIVPNASRFASTDRKEVSRYGRGDGVAQMPVILIPIHFDRESDSAHTSSFQHSVVFRPIVTRDFMTGRAAIPGDVECGEIGTETIVEMAREVANFGGVSRVLYDLTDKPPASLHDRPFPSRLVLHSHSPCHMLCSLATFCLNSDCSAACACSF